MAEVRIPNSRDRVRDRPPELRTIADAGEPNGLPMETGSEVEVVATPKRGRGRPRLDRNNPPPPRRPPDGTDGPKRASGKRRTATSNDRGSGPKRKYAKAGEKPRVPADDGKPKRPGRGRRKREVDDERSRKKNRAASPPVAPKRDDASSGEDSVVCTDDLPPPVTIPSTPPEGSPRGRSGRDPDGPRRLEDTSSGSGSSSSSSDSETERSGRSSVGSRLTDGSDRSVERAPSPPANNGYDRANPSPLGWSNYAHSESDDDADETNGGPPPGTPPRSPSSASSESADKSFQCHTCRKWFSSTVTLRIHKRSHLSKPGGNGGSGRSSRRYECDCCDATFTRRERLEQHRSETHRGSLTVRCEVCGRGFEDEEQQRKHAATHTADERAGRCTVCGEVVGGWEQLRKHRAIHQTPAVHACPLCRKAFTYTQSLTRHLQNHSKTVYKCVVCKTSFDDANALASHLNSHLDRYKQLKS